jgi:hypothetical protein
MTFLISKKTNRHFLDWFPLIASAVCSLGALVYCLLIELPVWLCFMVGVISFLVGYAELSFTRLLVKEIDSREEKNFFKKFFRKD